MNILTNIKKGIGDSLSASISSVWSQFFPSLVSYKAKLEQENANDDSLVDLLAELPQMYDVEDNVNLDNITEQFLDIENDVFSRLYQKFKDYIDDARSQKQQLINCISIITDVGQDYTFEVLEDPVSLTLEDKLYEIYVINRHLDDLTQINLDDIIMAKIDGVGKVCSRFRSRVISGVETSFTSAAAIMRSVAIRSSINEVILKAIKCLTPGSFNITVFNNGIEWAKDKASAARETYATICDAFASGGPYGVVQVLLHIINTGHSFSFNDSTGKFQFTDNKNLMPAQYIATVVTTILGTATQVVGAIVTAFSYPIGLAISLVGTILTALPKAFNYDYEHYTNAAIDTDAVFPISALACYQLKWLKSQTYSTLSDRIVELCEGYGTCFAQVPGGYIFFGLSGDEVLMEFHPLAYLDPAFHVAGRYALLSISNLSFDINNLRLTATIQPSYGFASGLNAFTARAGAAYSNVDIASMYETNEQGTMNDITDMITRHALVANVVLFHFWLQSAFDSSNPVTWTFNHFGVYNPTTSEDVAGWAQYYQVGLCDGESADVSLTIDRAVEAFIIMMAGTSGIDITFTSSQTGTSVTVPFVMKINSNVEYFMSWSKVIAGLSNFIDGSYSSVPAAVAHGWSFLSSITIAQFLSLIDQLDFYSDISALWNSEYKPFLLLPKYEKKTFWLWVALSAAVVIAGTIIVAVAAVKIKQKITQKRAEKNQNVENAHELAKQRTKEIPDPSDPSRTITVPLTSQEIALNYKAYKTAVRQNNWYVALFGGTKYNYTSYWDATDSTAGAATDLNTSYPWISDGSVSIESILTLIDSSYFDD